MKFALLAVAALAMHGGTAAAPAPPLRLTGPVKELAADGGRVAVLLQTSRPGCTVSRVAVWQPSTRSLAPIGASPCSESLSTGAGIFSVALAGTRVAYVQYGGGNIRELELRSATLAARRPVTLASASFSLDELSGTYIGRISGDGSLLAFDWWNVCPACAGNAGPQPDRSTIWRVAGSGACPNAGLGSKRLCTVVRTGPGTLRLLSATAGSLALLQPDRSVAVVTAAGATTATIPFAAGELRAARLDSDGRRLVALVSAGGAKNALRVYDSSGALAATYPLPAARTSGDTTCGDPNGCKTPVLRLEDVDSGIAVYVLGSQIHLVRLADGKTATIRPPGRTPVHAQLERDGLYYSFSPTARSSRVAFMPFAKLPWGA